MAAIQASVMPAIRQSLFPPLELWPGWGGAAIPTENLLVYLAAPNGTGDDAGKYLLPTEQSVQSATGWIEGTASLFFGATGGPVGAASADILLWNWANHYHVLFSDKGLAIYDPFAVSADTLNSAAQWLGVANYITGDPFTVALTEAHLSKGFFGYFDRTTTTSKRSFMLAYSSWVGYINGSSAKMRCGGYGPTPFMVAVDGGSGEAKTIVSGEVTLFAGLADGPHLVEIYVHASYSWNNNWIFTSGTFITITGNAPGVIFIGTGDIVTNPALEGQDTHAYTATFGGNFVPTYPKPNYVAAAGGYTNSGATRIRAACSELWVFTGDSEVWVSTDNGYPTKHTIGSLDTTHSRWRKITGFDSSAPHDYTIIGAANAKALVCVAAHGGLLPLLEVDNVVMQIGDSITRGTSVIGQTVGAVDVYKYCTAIDRMPASAGKGGVDIQTLTTDIPVFYSLFPAPDVVVLAIGRNNIANTEADFKSYYIDCINALLTAGAPKIVCRGITPGAWNTQNAWIAAVVAALANPNVVYVSPDSWSGIATADGTHPNETGYVTMADYEVIDFAGVI